MLMTTSEPAPANAGSGMNADEAAALYRLMTWLSPSFPVGAFSYSSGIEWAVEAGDITDAASLRDWLAAMLGDGSGFCDAVFLAQAHRAASARDEIALCEIAELAVAFVPSRERQLETSTQGRAFIEIARSAWACDGLDGMVAACGGAMVYPVAVGVVSAAHGFFEFGPVLRHTQRVDGEDLRLHMETQMETVPQQISQHHVELFLRGALGDFGNNVVAFLAEPFWSGNLVLSDPKSVRNQVREPGSSVRDADRVRRANAARREEHGNSPVISRNLDAPDRGDFESQVRLSLRAKRRRIRQAKE